MFNHHYENVQMIYDMRNCYNRPPQAASAHRQIVVVGALLMVKVRCAEKKTFFLWFKKKCVSLHPEKMCLERVSPVGLQAGRGVLGTPTKLCRRPGEARFEKMLWRNR